MLPGKWFMEREKRKREEAVRAYEETRKRAKHEADRARQSAESRVNDFIGDVKFASPDRK